MLVFSDFSNVLLMLSHLLLVLLGSASIFHSISS